jgi:hypothetical protein
MCVSVILHRTNCMCIWTGLPWALNPSKCRQAHSRWLEEQQQLLLQPPSAPDLASATTTLSFLLLAAICAAVSGTLLASGSDDLHIALWDLQSSRPLLQHHTHHSANIFCVKFMPGTGELQHNCNTPLWQADVCLSMACSARSSAQAESQIVQLLYRAWRLYSPLDATSDSARILATRASTGRMRADTWKQWSCQSVLGWAQSQCAAAGSS